MKLGYSLPGTLLVFLLFCFAYVSAQEQPPGVLQKDSAAMKQDGRHPLSFHGNLDFYYKHILHGTQAATTSFTSANKRFELGMLSVQLAYEAKKSGIVLDLGFGPRARDFAYTDKGAMAAIKQAYVYYDLIKGLRITAGTWATHIGYELLDPALNAHYSMSYLFSTGPFSNTGLKSAYTAGNHHMMVGISNPTDYRSVPENLFNRKTLIARYSYEKPGAITMALNYSGGRQPDSANLQQLDGVLALPLGSKLSLGWNGSVVFRKKPKVPSTESAVRSWNNWWGQALYLKADLSNQLQLALREEYFEDKKGLSAIPLLGSVWATTATMAFRYGDMTILPEIRWDQFSHLYGDAESANAPGSQWQALMAVTYQF